MDFSAPGSDDDGLMVDDAEQERRNEIVLALESWTTLAHRMYECNETIPRMRLQLWKALVGFPTIDQVPPTRDEYAAWGIYPHENSNSSNSDGFPAGSGAGDHELVRKRERCRFANKAERRGGGRLSKDAVGGGGEGEEDREEDGGVVGCGDVYAMEMDEEGGELCGSEDEVGNDDVPDGPPIPPCRSEDDIDASVLSS